LFTPHLASGAWEEAIGSNFILDEAVLDRAIEKIITNQSDYFVKQFEVLTNHQQRVLLSLIKENRNIFTSDFAEMFHLGPVSSTQRSVQRLLKEGIVSRQKDAYCFNDPFFRMWIEKTLV
jgi:DNA-binding MarR family transcriptional regulator